MAFEIRKAERKQAKARIGLGGPSGSGKTGSSLLMAYGLTGDWNDIGLIDTESGSGELYVNATMGGTHIGVYQYGRIEAPFTPQKYIDGIKAFEAAGVKVIIIDSLTHAWAGEGGLLDQQGREADRSGNSYTAWRKVTPQHNSLVEAILQSKCHILTTIRAKTEYTQEKDGNGKTSVKKVGMGLVQRDGMDYEFTIMLDLSADHIATASKDRTNLFDGQYFKPSVATGKQLLAWLEMGAPVKDEPAPQPQTTAAPATSTLTPPQPAPAKEPAQPTTEHAADEHADSNNELLALASYSGTNLVQTLSKKGTTLQTIGDGERDKTKAWLEDKPITEKKMQQLIITANQNGYSDDDQHAVIKPFGYESRKDIKAKDFAQLLTVFTEPIIKEGVK